MTPRHVGAPDALLVAAVVLGVAACGLCGWRWSMAWTQVSRSNAALAEARALVADLEQARERPAILAESPPSSDPLTMVKDTLGQAGIAESVLRRVLPEADGVIERIEGVTLPIRRSAVRVELDGVTLAELGRFLAAWRSRNPAWTPVLLNLSPQAQSLRDAAGPTFATGEPRWTVNMSAASLYVSLEEPKEPPAASAEHRVKPVASPRVGDADAPVKVVPKRSRNELLLAPAMSRSGDIR